MNFTSYFWGKKKEKKETQTIPTTIHLLYGAKVNCGNETSYVIGVYNDKKLAMKDLFEINEKHQLQKCGRSIVCQETNIKEYHYQYYLVDCDLNKNYNKSIEHYVYENLPSKI